MRVTFVLPRVNMSGGIRVAVQHAQALARIGHDVRIVSPPPPEQSVARKVRSWLEGRGWPARSEPRPSHLDGSGLSHIILDRWRPVTDADVPDADVVVATWWETAEWVNALDPAKGAKAYFIQHHETFAYLPIERSRATYRMPLHKIVVADWLREVMTEEYGDVVVDVVPNGVDTTRFFAEPRSKQPRPTVGVLYTTADFKGLDVTLAALDIVRRRHPDLRVVSFGSERLTPSHRLPPEAEFHYLPAQGRLRDLYAQCDVWVTASRSEGFNLPALEAMMCRTPVISTRTGWPAEAVMPGWNGDLVEFDDVPGLAASIERLLSLDDGAWRTLSDNAHATASATSLRRSSQMFEAALRHACRRAAKGEIAGRCTASDLEGSGPDAAQADRKN